MEQPFSIPSENFNGGENNSAEAVTLAPNQLQKAENCRLSSMGGFSMRPGYLEQSFPSFVGVGPLQGILETDYGIFFVNDGKIYLTAEDLSDAYEIYSGLDATARVRFLEYNGDIFLMNGVDRPRRIAKTVTATTLLAGVSATVSVFVGNGWRFSAGASSIFVLSALGGDTIAKTSITTDTIAITAGTVAYDHPIGSIILEVTTLPATVPIGTFGAVFQNTWFMAGLTNETGKKYSSNTVVYSVGASGLAPEKFWDFTGTGAGITPIDEKGEVTCLKNTKSYLMIGKKDRIVYCSGFDSNDDLILGLITDIYGIANPDCATNIANQLAVFTGTSLKRIGEQEGLNNTVPSLDSGFDAAFSKYFKTKLSADQSEAFITYNSKEELAKLWVTLDSGAKECVVIDNKLNPVTLEGRNAWMRDNNKQALMAVVYKNATYWASTTEAKIYHDEYGYDDNGLDITMTVKGADFNLSKPRGSKYFQTHYIRGNIYTGAEITVNYYYDGKLTTSFKLNDSLISDFSTGSLGTVTIGTSSVGGSVTYETLTGFEFEVEKLLLKRLDTGRIAVEYVCQGQAQVFEIKSQQIDGILDDQFIKKIRI